MIHDAAYGDDHYLQQVINNEHLTLDSVLLFEDIHCSSSSPHHIILCDRHANITAYCKSGVLGDLMILANNHYPLKSNKETKFASEFLHTSDITSLKRFRTENRKGF